MPATYRCAACDATWSANSEPTGCPQCGSRIIDRLEKAIQAFENHYNAPKAAISVASPVSSMAFSVTYWLGWAGIILGFVVLGMAGGMGNPAAGVPPNEPLAMTGGLLLLASGICLSAAYIVSLVKIYRGWDQIQPLRQIDRGAADMTTPGLAVGLLFVPFYNLYWNFVAIHGLAVRANRYLTGSGIAARPMNEGLAQTYCILILCSIIPCVGPAIALGNVVIYYLFILDVDRMRGAVQAWQGQGAKPEYLDDLDAL